MSLVWKFKFLTAAPGLAFLCLAFPSSLQVPQGWRGPCRVLFPHCPPRTQQVLVCCSCQSELCPHLPIAFSQEWQLHSVQSPAAPAVSACGQCLYTHRVNTITPFVLKRDSWIVSAVPNPFGPSHNSKTELDSLLPIAVGRVLAGLLQTQVGAIAWWITLSNLQTGVPWLCFAFLWANSQVVFCARREGERCEEMILSAKILLEKKKPQEFLMLLIGFHLLE